MKAEREKRAVITEAEGERQAAVTPRRGREAIRHPSGRGPAGEHLPIATPRPRATLRPGGGGRHQVGFRRDRGRQRQRAQLFRRPEIRRGVRQTGRLAAAADGHRARRSRIDRRFNRRDHRTGERRPSTRWRAAAAAAATGRPPRHPGGKLTVMGAVEAFYFAHPFWSWLAVGAVFLIVEVMTGSGWLLWPAGSAAAVGFDQPGGAQPGRRLGIGALRDGHGDQHHRRTPLAARPSPPRGRGHQ